MSSLVPSQLAPSGLRWESTKTLDIALEGALFNDRLNFSVGYYNKRNTDLLFWRNAAPSSGSLGNTITTPRVLQNIGTMENIGWEIQLSGDVVRTKDFRWNLGCDASFLKNKIRSLPDNQDIPGQALFVGKSLYEMYTYEFAGVDQTNGRSLYFIDPNSPDYYTYDENNKRVYQPDDYITDLKNAAAAGQLIEINGKYYTYNTSNASRKIFGTSLPTVFGAFNSSFSWKNLNVGLLFQYSLGGKTYDSNYASLVSVGTTAGNALHKDILNSWKQKPEGVAEHEQVTSTINYVDAEGNEQSVTINNVLRAQGNAVDPNGIPQLNSVNNSYNNSSSSRFLLKNDYIIFKNVNISYDFPKHWVNAIKLQALNLGVSIDNVFIGAKRKGLSPQYNFSGGQGQYFVPARVYSVSLTAKF